MVGASGQGVTGRQSVHVAKPAAVSSAMGFAASELSRYLEAMTGSDFPVVHDKNSGSAFRLELDTDLGDDGYRISHRRGAICISGGNGRGCLYGAYAFLQELGCRWPLPGKQNEIVPKLRSISWRGHARESRPAFKRRGMIIVPNGDAAGLLDFVGFLAKNAFNYVYLAVRPDPPDELLARALNEREMGVEYGGHLLPGLLPRELFQEHPEYFRMENGKRTPDLNMCPSNSEAAKIMAKNAEPALKNWSERVRLETMHLHPDDLYSGGWCSCEKCAGLSQSDQELKILNMIAERLPLGDAKLSYLTYHATCKPPTRIKPSNGIRLLYAPRERCYRHAMGGCEANGRYLQYLKGLVKAVPNDATVHEYYDDCILFRYLPIPLHPTIAKDMKVYREAGVQGVQALSFQRYSDCAYGPNTYVLGKALWRGEGKPQDIREYCSALYGPAAGPMEQYFNMLFELSATAMETCGYPDNTDLRWPPTGAFARVHAERLAPLIEDRHLDKIEEKLREALEVSNEPYKARIEDQATLYKFARIEVVNIYKSLLIGSRISPLLKGMGTEADRADVISTSEEVIKGINAGTDVLNALPKRFGANVCDYVVERTDSYQPVIKTWMQQLKELQSSGH